MSDIHALSGAYAIHALDEFERAQFERHLATCPTCQSEVDSLCDAAAMLAETTPAPPWADLRSRVLAEITTVRPLPPVVTPVVSAPATAPAPIHRHAAERRRASWVTGLAAAAAAVVAIGTGGVVYQQVHSDHTSNVADTAVTRVLHAKDAQRFNGTVVGGGTASVVRSAQLAQAVLVTHGIPSAPAGKQYVLWLQRDGVLHPAGTTTVGGDRDVLFTGDAADATGAGVTIEDADTAPTTPSDQVVVFFDFRQA